MSNYMSNYADELIEEIKDAVYDTDPYTYLNISEPIIKFLQENDIEYGGYNGVIEAIACAAYELGREGAGVRG